MNQSSIVEGISDEVLIVPCFILLGLIIIVYRLKRGLRAVSGVIHPDSQDIVNETRQHVRQQRQPRESNGDATCAVCIDTLHYGVETNCGHTFCGRCIITYWQTGRWTGPVACPICRQTVNILLMSFTRAEVEEQSQQKNELIDQIYNYNRRFSGEPRTVWEYIQDLPVLLRHAISDLFSVNGMVMAIRFRIIVLGVLALLYLFSPLDIIPEALIGALGFIDDLIIVAVVAVYISVMYRAWLAQRSEAHHHQN